MQVPVKDIQLNNTEFLDILNEYKDVLMQRETPDGEPLIARKCPLKARKEKAEDWVSDEYLQALIKKGREHEGFPKVLRGYTGIKYTDYHPGQEKVYKESLEVLEATSILNKKLIEFLSANNNALNACYPPGGFISWHNNANAEGYNIICTWSETGEGWFDYWDIEKQERVRVQDVPGWQAKMTYFGSYDKPDKLCYHAAYSDCHRITVAFVFKEADEFWEEVIEDLENPL